MINLSENYKSALSHYTYIDLFAGIGGFHLALSSFGASCVFVSEWDENAAKIYKKNFAADVYGDITKINENEIPSHDILCGGFPCQAFSISGKQRGFEDIRGTLFFDIARIAKHHQPKVLFLENVANFEKHDDGKTLIKILDVLNEIGYKVSYKVLNASNYGVPQARERIYFICLRKDLKCHKFEFPQPNNIAVSLKEYLLEKVDMPNIDLAKHNGIIDDKKLNPASDLLGGFPQKPIRIGTVNNGGQGERIYHILGHAITLSAYGGGIGAKTGLYKVGEIIRKLHPRECARISGFPDEFIISENKNHSYKQFGNSVVVDVLQYILKALVDQKIL